MIDAAIVNLQLVSYCQQLQEEPYYVSYCNNLLYFIPLYAVIHVYIISIGYSIIFVVHASVILGITCLEKKKNTYCRSEQKRGRRFSSANYTASGIVPAHVSRDCVRPKKIDVRRRLLFIT